MYRIAVVQNESEMMRYGWADVRPSIRKNEYKIDAYTGENIQLMFKMIEDNLYEAVLIAANSCNNYRILAALRENRDKALKHLLDTGKGLYIGYQAKIGQADSFGFLPEPYDISTEIRNRQTENTSDGILSINKTETQHPLITFPKQIEVKTIVQQCLYNNLVTGIYWAHLKPCSQGVYQPILIDTKYETERNIIIVSRPDLQPRMVVSTLVVEWQGHDALWENILHYIVEGRPSLAIVCKRGTGSLNFRYLTTSIQIKKLAAATYELRELGELSKLPIGPHDALILDPSWDEHEILAYDEKHPLCSKPGFSRVFYFGNSRRGDVILNTISQFKDFNRISKNATTWLISQGGSKNKPYWGGSFWTTVDVLAALVDFEYPVTQYEGYLRSEIEKHDIDGSYDEVVGTTCGLLEVYYWLFGSKDARYLRTLNWIKTHFSDKTPYERATAIDVIVRLNENIESHILTNFKNEIMTNFRSLTFSNEFTLQRYISTLFTCGFIEEAEQLALQLKNLQDIADGRWINIPNTAAITLTLIHLQSKSKKRNALIDEMIFKGIEFLKNSYSDKVHSWEGDPLATALSLRALKAFEKQVTFPVDEILVALENVSKEARSMIAIDTAIKLNSDLQDQINKLHSESLNALNNLTDELQNEKKDARFAKKLSLTAGVFSLAMISLMILFVGYCIKNEKFNSLLVVLGEFFASTYLLIISVLALIPLMFVVLLLRRYKMLPEWLDGLLNLIKK